MGQPERVFVQDMGGDVVILEALRARVLALHPYEVPEVIALPVEAGHAPYLDWIEASTR